MNKMQVVDEIVNFDDVNDYLKSINKPPLPFDNINLTNMSLEERKNRLRLESNKAYEWLMKYVGIVEK